MGEEVAGHPGQTGRAHHDRPLPWTDHPGCRREGPTVTTPYPELTIAGQMGRARHDRPMPWADHRRADGKGPP